MKNKPDNRDDNVENIQRNINFTIKNMELADDMIGKTDDEKTKRDLKEKNKRRADSLEAMRKEIKDESDHQKEKRR